MSPEELREREAARRPYAAVAWMTESLSGAC